VEIKQSFAKQIASNASANIFSGLVAACYQVALVSIATRYLDRNAFAIWAIAISIASILPIFACNLSSVVTRKIIYEIGTQGDVGRKLVIAAGKKLEKQIGFISIITMSLVGIIFIYTSTKNNLTFESFFPPLFLFLMANLWFLMNQVRFGEYFADRKNWPPSIFMAGSRIGGILAILMEVALFKADPLNMSLALAIGAWGGLLIAQHFFKTEKNNQDIDISFNSFELAREYEKIVKIFTGFIVWSLGGLFIQYGIPLLVAYDAPHKFNAFYIASSINMIAVGGISAAIAPLLAPLSSWHSQGKKNYLRRYFLLSSPVSGFLSLGVMIVCWYLVLNVIVARNNSIAEIGAIKNFLALLGFQTIIRMTTVGYSTSVASYGSRKLISLNVFVEILLVIFMALPMGYLFGVEFLIYGLIISGFGSSIFMCIAASCHSNERLDLSSLKKAMGTTFLTQLVASGLWTFAVINYIF
jgi:hypothetical protein